MLLRSSQPLVGIMGQRNEQDELLLAEVGGFCWVRAHALTSTTARASSSKEVVVADARPSVNAVGNTVMGAGYENTDHYEASHHIDKVHLKFIGALRLHIVRALIFRVQALPTSMLSARATKPLGRCASR